MCPVLGSKGWEGGGRAGETSQAFSSEGKALSLKGDTPEPKLPPHFDFPRI